MDDKHKFKEEIGVGFLALDKYEERALLTSWALRMSAAN